MVRETFWSVKQVGCILSEREIIKNGDIFVEEKWWLTLSYNWLFLDGKKGKLCMDPENDKKKKVCEKGTLRKEFLHFRIKIILNLVR